jgi:hypothetical protein
MAYCASLRVHVALHRPEPTAEEDWEAYFLDIEKHLPTLEALFVVAPHSDLSARQRRLADRFWASQRRRPPIGVLTSSALVRVIANTFSALLANPIRAFAMDDFEGAASHLALKLDQRQAVKLTVRELSAALGIAPPL